MTELRAVYADSFRTGPARYADKAVAAVQQDRGAGLLAETFRAQEACLAFALESNTLEDITAAARTLSYAERIYVAAFMSCRGPGLTFTYLCKMLRPNVEFLGSEGSSLVADLSMLTGVMRFSRSTFSPMRARSTWWLKLSGSLGRA